MPAAAAEIPPASAAAPRQASEAELVALLRAANGHFQSRDYPSTIAAALRYFKEGGVDATLRWTLGQAYFLNRDPANAARELQTELLAAERAGRVPDEEHLLLLQRCYQQLGDGNATLWSLEKLVTYHPRKAYWAELLARLAKRSDFTDHLAVDVLRLRLLTGSLDSAVDYLELVAQLRRHGLPIEAQQVLERGFASGLLGSGPDAGRHRQLRDAVSRQAQDEARRLAQPSAEAAAVAASGGMALFNLGLAHVSLGDGGKGLALMERGIARGDLENRPQIAKLRLAAAYLGTGNKARALEIFRSVGGQHGAADLARLWAIYARGAPP